MHFKNIELYVNTKRENIVAMWSKLSHTSSSKQSYMGLISIKLCLYKYRLGLTKIEFEGPAVLTPICLTDLFGTFLLEKVVVSNLCF